MEEKETNIKAFGEVGCERISRKDKRETLFLHYFEITISVFLSRYSRMHGKTHPVE